jgi:hypothetical protein
LLRDGNGRNGPIASHARHFFIFAYVIGVIVANGIQETPEEKIYAAFIGKI